MDTEKTAAQRKLDGGEDRADGSRPEYPWLATNVKAAPLTPGDPNVLTAASLEDGIGAMLRLRFGDGRTFYAQATWLRRMLDLEPLPLEPR